MTERNEMPTQEYILRAMATNYAGGHCWDHLDGEACTKAADEIKALRSAAPAPLATSREAAELAATSVRAAADRVCWFDWSDNDTDAVAAIEALRTALAAPAPLEVQDTWLVGGPPDLKAMSGSVESDRVIQLHFRRKATDADRAWLLDAINAKIAADAAPAPLATSREVKNQFHFWMDARRFSSDRARLTGGEIKAIANTSPSYPVYRDAGPRFSDHEAVGDGVLVDVDGAHFYSLIPATYRL